MEHVQIFNLTYLMECCKNKMGEGIVYTAFSSLATFHSFLAGWLKKLQLWLPLKASSLPLLCFSILLQSKEQFPPM